MAQDERCCVTERYSAECLETKFTELPAFSCTMVRSFREVRNQSVRDHSSLLCKAVSDVRSFEISFKWPYRIIILLKYFAIPLEFDISLFDCVTTKLEVQKIILSMSQQAQNTALKGFCESGPVGYSTI